ncbi:hypothetical protein A0J61_01383 [Choanephora cucurbitarum]|uniref:Copper-fist domain-containing protein n=1 Tax=Choanephora cucurbitarum TaxID=101091 RepID=A0A1C7NN62_9FUNG|nr:hypothetical protein A0J61_01383 [Choanephora cucurbitarum]
MLAQLASRDLRKTKQVHIKCACDKKGIESQNQQPLRIYQQGTTSKHNTEEGCQDQKPNVKSQCTCPAIAAAAAVTTTTNARSNKSSSNTPLSSLQDTLATEAASDTLMSTAPLCPTATPPSSVNGESLSYSWALITSPSTNQIDLPNTSTSATPSNLFTSMMNDDQIGLDNTSNVHLGFIFHKPTTTQRFLDGQPRVRRRRSTKRGSNRLPINAVIDPISTTVDAFTDYSSLSTPSSAVSPHPPSSASSSTAPACEPMDMQFDYLTEQLEILSNNHQNQSFIGDELANADELTAILNNVLSKEEDINSVSSSTSNSYRSSISAPTYTSTPTASAATVPIPMPTTSGGVNPMIPSNLNQQSHCGSFVPRSKCCKPLGSPGGESVVITITPLASTTKTEDMIENSTTSSMQQQTYPTTTRIVTCYCGSQCACPGCLVHPGNFFLGSDPYVGPLIPSSSASSSCYGSDEEDASVSAANTTFHTSMNSGSNSNYLHFP